MILQMQHSILLFAMKKVKGLKRILQKRLGYIFERIGAVILQQQ